MIAITHQGEEYVISRQFSWNDIRALIANPTQTLLEIRVKIRNAKKERDAAIKSLDAANITKQEEAEREMLKKLKEKYESK